jgi:hypothetical protein
LTTWTTISSPGAAAAARRLDPREHDLVDVQEAVLVQADVDEGGLEAGQHVVDPALVDVADDRAVAATLEVELGDLVAGGGVGGPAAPGGLGRGGGLAGRHGAGRFEQRHAGLTPIDAYQYLLLQWIFLCESLARRAWGGGNKCCARRRTGRSDE